MCRREAAVMSTQNTRQSTRPTRNARYGDLCKVRPLSLLRKAPLSFRTAAAHAMQCNATQCNAMQRWAVAVAQLGEVGPNAAGVRSSLQCQQCALVCAALLATLGIRKSSKPSLTTARPRLQHRRSYGNRVSRFAAQVLGDGLVDRALATAEHGVRRLLRHGHRNQEVALAHDQW